MAQIAWDLQRDSAGRFRLGLGTQVRAHIERRFSMPFDKPAARVADYIREKKWHDSQQLKELKGGGVELRLTLSSLIEVQRWVLGWGSDVMVVKPRQLQEAVQQTAREILAQSAPPA